MKNKEEIQDYEKIEKKRKLLVFLKVLFRPSSPFLWALLGPLVILGAVAWTFLKSLLSYLIYYIF